ncbi:amidohydrolase family protein [Streptomyces sp. NPDC058614]|uniref:amidohydrolase family protein n=1 Tax=Streptomyces sp. NPDC058614 TaxID=3346557 RepID=UPI0036621A30
MRIDTHVHLSTASCPPPPGMPAPPFVSAEALLGMIDRYSIDGAVLSPVAPGVFFGDPADIGKRARLVNEEVAEAVRAHPNRFAGLMLLPLPDLHSALAELAYGFDVLGLDGVLLMTNYKGSYVGDPNWAPLYAELDRRGAYVFVHPTMPGNGQALEHPPWLYEFPFDTTRAVTNLIYSGVAEDYPNIRWQIAHCGGTAPFLADRIGSLSERAPKLAERAPAGAVAYLSRFYYDTGLANNEYAYRGTRLVVSADRLVFGTDWPNCPLPEEGSDPAPGLGFLDDAERAALDANAAVLVPRLAAQIAADREAGLR